MVSKTQNIVEKETTVKWIVSDEKIIRFEDSDTVYDMSDAVASLDFKKYGIDKGTKVSVKIDTNAGDNGTIVFMKKEETIAEVKKEIPKIDTSSKDGKKVLTVAGISFKTKGIIFEEEEKVWYTISDSIGVNNLKNYGIEKGIKVEVSVSDPSKEGGNKVITFIKKVTDSAPVKIEEKTESDSKPETKQNYTKTNYQKGNYSNDTQTSIEAQAAVNSACGLVGSMIHGQSVETLLSRIEDIKQLRKAFAEDNFKLIQELKKNQA